MFARTEADLLDKTNILPLVRKNFVRRTGLDGLLSKVIEEKGVRSYRNGEVHYHQTDGIVFQPDADEIDDPFSTALDKQILDTDICERLQVRIKKNRMRP